MPVRLAATTHSAGHRQLPYQDGSLCRRPCQGQADCQACQYRDGETDGLAIAVLDGDESPVGVGDKLVGAVPSDVDEAAVGAEADGLVVGAGVGGLVAGAGVGGLVAGAGVGELVVGAGVGGLVVGAGVGELVVGAGVGELAAGAAGVNEELPEEAGAGAVGFAEEATGQVTFDVSVYTGCAGVTVVETTGAGAVETAGLEVVAAVGAEVFEAAGVEVAEPAGVWVLDAADVGVFEAAAAGASVAEGGTLVWPGCGVAVTGSALGGHVPAGVG